ncbi:hypothetical protein ABIF66_008854 [Bradyrhizobium japonicum]|uniref:helix-turn-helix transcriptional regulator n=1 Tax=Bradyrhizobium liaoningense TaxID=43992 RepID=UPI001BA95B14|nr:helix-turn-helix domain-containing protein [Bradyrhizobium liaoningense]MBR1070230.1 helix-turn-helix domain-containing protein [Bradyrhizobium liaoningense]
MQTEIHGNAGSKSKTKPGKQIPKQPEPRKVQRRKLMASVAIKPDAPVVTTDYMTTIEAAAYIKFSRQFLEGARYKGDGSGPPYIKVGRAVRYRRPVLDAWMSKHDHPADKPIQLK